MAAEHGGELEKTMYKLKMKRERLLRKMKEDDERLNTVNAQIESRTERLQKVTNRKNNRMIAKKEYEKTIMETESAYKKILDSSMAILDLLKTQANAGNANDELERELEEEHEAEEKAKTEGDAGAAEGNFAEEMAHLSQDESDEEEEEAPLEEANSVEDEEVEEDEEEWEEEEEDEEEWEEEEVEEEE
jgi:Sjoegren syndrome nuclear autoantigen 1